MSFYGQQLTFLVKTVEQFSLIKSKAVKIQCNPYQNSHGSPCRGREKNPKLHVESQGTPNCQNNLEKEEQSCGLTRPDFKTYHSATVMTVECYWRKDWCAGHCHRTQCRKNLVYVAKWLSTRVPRVHSRKRTVPLQRMVLGKLAMHVQKNRVRLLPYTIYRVN